MKFTAALVLVTISMVHGSVIGGIGLVGPASVGAALKGPSAAATLVGPDGSAISSAVEGGAVIAAPQHGGVINAAVAPGVVATHGAWGVPSVVSTHGAWGAPGVWAGPGAWAAPAVALGGHGAVIQGPSGIVATNGNPWGHGVGVVGLGLGHGLWGH